MFTTTTSICVYISIQMTILHIAIGTRCSPLERMGTVYTLNGGVAGNGTIIHATTV